MLFLSSVERHVVRRFMRAQRKSLFVSFISLFSLLGVAIGSFALVLVLSGINGFEDKITSQMMSKDAHVEIAKYGYAPDTSYGQTLAMLDSDPRVTAAAPFLLSKIGISSRNANDGIVLYGLDPVRSPKVLGIEKALKYGHFQLDSAPDTGGVRKPGVYLGVNLAERLRVGVGDRIVLQTFQDPDMAGTPVLVQCVITGLFQTGLYEYDANIAYVSIPTAQRLLGMEGAVTGVHFNLQDPWMSGEAVMDYSTKMGTEYKVWDWREKNGTLLKWMGLEKILFGAVIGLIVLVAAFNIISSLIMLVSEKTREIGILRAMGFSAWSILRIFIAVGGMIGLMGTTLGTSVGLGVALAQIHWEFIQLPPDVYMMATLPMKVEWLDVIIVFGFANLICLLATIPPALKAAFMHPVNAIRHE